MSNNFDPRIDKWKADPVDGYMLDLKDGIVNKGKQERMAKNAWKRAQREDKFRKSFIGRIWLWFTKWLGRILGLATLLIGGAILFVVCRFVFGLFGFF